MFTEKDNSPKKNGIACTENVRVTKSITSSSAIVDFLVNTREKVSHMQVFIRTESESTAVTTIKRCQTISQRQINWLNFYFHLFVVFFRSRVDMVLHWSAWDQLNYPNFTKKLFYSILDRDISWKKTIHATTWASQKKKTLHLLWIKIQHPINRPKTVSPTCFHSLFGFCFWFFFVFFCSWCVSFEVHSLRLRFKSIDWLKYFVC